ncbi:MAG: rod shape-determining protein [Oscillatoriales cyanobacterium]|nr:MAG: rod shape-determining protein [Oscillatoriales cyanobacterium]
MGIDLGTANTLIDQDLKIPLAVGEDAKKMLGRTPGNVIALRPLRDGVIADFDTAELMLKTFIRRVHEGKSLVSPRIIIGIPSGVTGVERRAVIEAATQAGAREVRLIDEPIAAAIGAGLPVAEATGNMIIDIGGGTTEVAVLSLQGTVISESVRVAGDELNEAIVQYMKKVHNLVIGERTAEEIKIQVGSAYPTTEDDDAIMEVRGLHLLSGLPRTVTIKGPEIRESMSEPLSVIVEAVKRTLERTPPELAADIIDRGIMLAGGGALMKGLDTLISHETGIVTHVAADPLCCVVLGTGRVLENKQLERVFSGQSSRNM